MTPRAAGIALLHSGRLLLLRRRPDCVAGGCWALPGGKIEDGETPEQAALRELREETGLSYDGPLHPLGTTPDGFRAFLGRVDVAHAPMLNGEHTAALWAPYARLPAPLHPGLAAQLCAAADPDACVRAVLARLR